MAKLKFIGLQYPLSKTQRGTFAQKHGVDQIKADLLQLLLTNPGERCLTGGAKIPLANGTEFPIKDLVDKPPFWVYSFDLELNMIVPGKAIAHKTLKNAELMEIILDNEEIVRCTPNHLWLLRDGKYCRADELKNDFSLMSYESLTTVRQKNHKVLSIKKSDIKEDCFDLSVEKYHNFALSAGCFVHNCMLPEYGTPLRKLFFEPNDPTIETQARAMIAKSISTWEPRIIVSDIQIMRRINRNDLHKDDSQDEIESILGIKIMIVDPENISEINELVLELPIGGN